MGHARAVPAERLPVDEHALGLRVVGQDGREVLVLEGERLGGQKPNVGATCTFREVFAERGVAVGGCVRPDGIPNAPMGHDAVDECVLTCGHPWLGPHGVPCLAGLWPRRTPARLDAVHEVVKGIVEGAKNKDAVAAFKAEYQLQTYRAFARGLFEQIDFLVSPTAPRSYLIRELLGDPITLNSNMGYYTNYMNLLDLCGVAVPAGFMSNGIPFGVTLIAPCFREISLLNQALRWEQQQQLPMGASDQVYRSDAKLPAVTTSDQIKVAVCGAHLSGMPLNWQLAERGATLVAETETSANYRFYALAGGPVKRPGLMRHESNGCRIKVEVWSVPAAEFGGFVSAIPYPLGIGKLELISGEWVSGFICEAAGLAGSEDISALGSWRSYIATLSS